MIKLSRLTDYAVVIMAELASAEGERISASVLSERTRLPEPTVAKVLKILSKHSLISSSRGINGGYRLESTPDEMNVTSIIEAMEGPILLTACVQGNQELCALEGMCNVKGRWTSVNVAIKSALENITLADMVNR